MDYKNILILSITTVNLILSLFILKNDIRSRINIIYGVFTLNVSFWCLAHFFYRYLPYPEQAFFPTKLTYVFASIIPSSHVFFSIFFQKDDEGSYSWQKTITIIFNLLIIYLALNNQVITAVQVVPGMIEKQVVLGKYYWIFFIYLPSFFMLSFYCLIKKYIKSTGQIKLQIFYVLFGTLISSSIASITNLLLPLFGNTELTWIGSISTVLMTGCTTYAITKTQLMDIRIIINRSMAFFILMLIYTFIGIVSILIYSQFFSFGVNYLTLFFITLLLLFTGLTFHPFRLHLQTTPDKFLFRKKYIYDQAIKELAEISTRKLKLDEVIKIFSSKAKEVSKTKRAEVFILDSDGNFKL